VYEVHHPVALSPVGQYRRVLQQLVVQQAIATSGETTHASPALNARRTWARFSRWVALTSGCSHMTGS
jgi:hypothetical protein